jgi:biotin carboxyl carrier protein
VRLAPPRHTPEESASTSMPGRSGGHREMQRPRLRRRWMAGTAILTGLGIAGAVMAIAHPFGAAPRPTETASSVYPTGLQTVTEGSISSETPVSGTLGYAGSYSVVAPSGTTQQQLMQAEEQVASAQSTLASDRTQASDGAASSDAGISEDQAQVSSDHSKLATDQATENTDCTTSPSGGACAADKQTVANDRTQLTQAENQLAVAQLSAKEGTDQANAKVNADEASLQDAESAFAAAQASAVTPGTTYTSLPAVGETVKEGQPLYAVNGLPVTLLYGGVTPWRDFQPGMSDGADVGELNADLWALGFGSGISPGNHFSAGTETAIRRWFSSPARSSSPPSPQPLVGRCSRDRASSPPVPRIPR